MTSFAQRGVIALALLALSLPATADFKIVRRTSFPRREAPAVPRIPPLVETIWVQGPRLRSQAGVGWIYLHQCDKSQLIQINPETRLFHIQELGPDGLLKRNIPPQAKGSMSQSGYEYTVTTQDTGQRATVFSYPAWLVRDTITSFSRRRGHRNKTVVETWYIDLGIALGCQKSSEPLAEYAGWRSDIRVTRVGEAKRGLPVLTRRLVGDGERRHEVVVEVTEISRMGIDPQFFEVPPDHQPGLDGPLKVPATPANRARAAWEGFWLRLAKMIY